MALVRASNKPHYVYVLSKLDGTPFYVGVGTGRRILDHSFYARRATGDSHKLRVIRKALRDGEDIDYAIVAWFDDRSDAERAEADLILKIGRRDLRTGPLANVTAGGEGAAGLSDDGRAAKSAKSKAAWARRDKDAGTAHLRSPDVVAKAAATRKGKQRGSYVWTKRPGMKTAEARQAASVRMAADPPARRPGVAEKISAAKRGKPINSWMRTAAAKERFSRGAHPRARPVEIDGQAFACKQDAVDALGICLSTVDYWLKRGSHGARYLPK